MRGLLLLVAGATATAVSMLLARVPGVVERVYGSGPGPWISRTLSLATGWSPVSVSWLIVLALTGWGWWRFARGARRVRSGQAGAWAATAGGLEWLAGVAGVLLVAFYLFWGLNYARAPVDERLGLGAAGEGDGEELRRLTLYSVREVNEAYRSLHAGTDDAGAPTGIRFDPVAVSSSLESGWKRVGPSLGMGVAAARSHGPVKTVGVTWLLDALDLSGIYSPWTGEAHVSASLPSMVLPATAAHEQAHQRGVARENEATFTGVLAAIHADDAYVRYSGWSRILRELQRDLARVDREAWEAAMKAVVPGVRRDWVDYTRWYEENRSVAGPVASAVNDRYLRAHAVPGGILSYARVTALLVAWADRNEGNLSLSSGVTKPLGSSGPPTGPE